MKPLPLLWALLLCALCLPLSAQDRSYTEGPVMEVTAVKVMDGQFDNYMTHLQGPYKRVMESPARPSRCWPRSTRCWRAPAVTRRRSCARRYS